MGTYRHTVILMIITLAINTLLSLLLSCILYMYLGKSDTITFRKLFTRIWLTGTIPTLLSALMFESGHGIPWLLVLRDLFIVWAVLQMAAVMWLTTKYKVIKKDRVRR